jgi:homoserine O-acetyltransferase/O-succinyltransferase
VAGGRLIDVEVGPLGLESGAVLERVRVRVGVWGELDGAEPVLVTHALTADARAGAVDDHPGWWDPLIGEGRLFDPAQAPVLCMNVLGSCYGTTGPGDPAPDGQPWGLRFPVVTVRDMVRLEAMVLDSLGVERVRLVIGGSVGGMQAAEWARLFGGRVRKAVSIGAPDRMLPQSLAWNAVQRSAIVSDPEFDPTRPGPTPGLARAREIAMITYRGDRSMERQFGRRLMPGAQSLELDAPSFAVESYLRYQGERLRDRFCALSYLVLIRAMDSHDIFAPLEVAPPGPPAPIVYVGISSDILFPAERVRESATEARRRGQAASYLPFVSDYGHDAFLVEAEVLGRALRPALIDVLDGHAKRASALR